MLHWWLMVKACETYDMKAIEIQVPGKAQAPFRCWWIDRSFWGPHNMKLIRTRTFEDGHFSAYQRTMRLNNHLDRTHGPAGILPVWIGIIRWWTLICASCHHEPWPAMTIHEPWFTITRIVQIWWLSTIYYDYPPLVLPLHADCAIRPWSPYPPAFSGYGACHFSVGIGRFSGWPAEWWGDTLLVPSDDSSEIGGNELTTNIRMIISIRMIIGAMVC